MKKKSILLFLLLIVSIVCFTGCGSKKLEYFTVVTEMYEKIPINETKKIEVYYYPEDVKEEITWSSSNDEIASVENGAITTKTTGEVTITGVTESGIRRKFIVNVYKKADNLALDKSDIEMYVGETSQIVATLTPEDATYNEVKWTNTNNNVASVENGLVTAKEAGETTITATTEEGLKQTCTIIVKDKPIEFSGSGDQIISDINIPKGSYKAVLNNNGRSNFIVKFYESSNDSRGDLLANEIGNYYGSVVIRDGKTNQITDGMLEIKSSGSWSIVFEPISETIQEKSISGSGDVVTGWFKGDGKRQVATFTNSGSSNFIVYVYDEYGGRDLLVNEIGSYNGQTTFTTNSTSKYYYEVVSSGDWTISWE